MTLIGTRIQNIRSNSNLDKNELRVSRYGALDLFMKQTDEVGGVITQELKEKAENSIGSVLETPVIDYDAGVTIGNTRTAVIADAENTSRMYALNFATFAWGFTTVPARHINNEIGEQKDFERKFLKHLYKFLKELDNQAIAALELAKTQVIVDPLTYTVTANEIVCSFEERENILGDLNPIMSANDHFGLLHVVGNGGIESTVQKLAQKDIFNSENKTLEYSDKMLHFSSNIPNDATEYANLYAVEEGSVGILTRVEAESLLGTKSKTGHEWGTEVLPLANMTVGTYSYDSVGDLSGTDGVATSHITRGMKKHFGFAVDVCFVTPFNSDPANIANPIVKVSVTRA